MYFSDSSAAKYAIRTASPHFAGRLGCLYSHFCGMTGIVAGSLRAKATNVIPGVAIATALMPLLLFPAISYKRSIS
ncbi:DUF389 domain-containing protein [Larkinella ripae]